jgi:hypothetical protein
LQAFLLRRIERVKPRSQLTDFGTYATANAPATGSAKEEAQTA